MTVNELKKYEEKVDAYIQAALNVFRTDNNKEMLGYVRGMKFTLHSVINQIKSKKSLSEKEFVGIIQKIAEDKTAAAYSFKYGDGRGMLVALNLLTDMNDDYVSKRKFYSDLRKQQIGGIRERAE